MKHRKEQEVGSAAGMPLDADLQVSRVRSKAAESTEDEQRVRRPHGGGSGVSQSSGTGSGGAPASQGAAAAWDAAAARRAHRCRS